MVTKFDPAQACIIDVHKNNICDIWPTMLLALKLAKFVAIDLELSGIGKRKDLMAASIEDR